MIALTLLAAGTLLQPLGLWRDWVTVRDYPIEAVLGAQEGSTSFALSIDANGLPQDCRITKSSGSKLLDDQTCAVMLIRARFRPAIDKAGHPIPATYRQTIRWHLPPQTRAGRMTNRNFDALSTIALDGTVTRCVLTGGGAGKGVQAKGDCGPFGQRAFLASYLKENYARTRAANVRLSVTIDEMAPPALPHPPSLYLVLAKAALDIDVSGRMSGCTNVQTLDVGGKSTDLCDLIKADPPRYLPRPQPRKAIVLLDLSADYR